MSPLLLQRSGGRLRGSGKKINFNVSFEILRDCILNYQHTVKTAREKYLSDLISKNAHSPKVLFNTINTVFHPVVTSFSDPTPVTCDNFLQFFINKTEVIRSGIPIHTLREACYSSFARS